MSRIPQENLVGYQKNEYQQSFREAIRELTPVVVALYHEVLSPTAPDARRAQYAVVQNLAATTLYDSFAADLELKHTGYGSKNSAFRILGDRFSRAGIDFITLDERASAGLEAGLFRSRLPENIRREKTERKAQAFVYQTETDTQSLLDRSIQRIIFSESRNVVKVGDIISQAKAEKISLKTAVDLMTAVMARGLKKGLRTRTEAYQSNTILGEAAHILTSLSASQYRQRDILTTFKRIKVNGKVVMRPDAVFYQTGKMLPRSIRKKIWDKPHQEGGLNKSEKAVIALLLLYHDAPVEKKMAMIIRDKELLHAYKVLPEEMKARLVGWEEAAFLTGSVTSLAREYANQMTSMSGKIVHRAQRIRSNLHPEEVLFSSIQTHATEQGHVKPVFATFFSLAVVSFAVSCGLLLSADDGTPTHVAPTGTSIPDVSIITQLQPSLDTVISQLDIQPNCDISADLWATAQNAPGLEVVLNSQLSYVESALSQAGLPWDIKNATLECFVSGDGQYGGIHLALEDGTLLVPTADGFEVGRMLDNGVVVPETLVFVDSSNPYPIDASGFILGGGGSNTDALNYLMQIAPEDTQIQIDILNALADLYGISNAELVAFIHPNSFTDPENAAHTIAILDLATGRYWIPELVHPDGTTELIRSTSLFAYEDLPIQSFGLREIINPPQYPNGKQQLIGDASKWIVVGLFDDDGNLVAWFDADYSQWRNLNNDVIATMTPVSPLGNAPVGESVSLVEASSGEDQITQERVNAARIERIQLAQQQLANNSDVWGSVPESCARSMLKIGVYGTEGDNGGSASLIHSEHLVDQWGNPYFVYHLLVSDHAMRNSMGAVIDGIAVLYPLSYDSDQRFSFSVAGYSQILDQNGNGADEGILTVYGGGSWADMSETGIIPLGVDNVRGIDTINHSGILYSFDYPGIIKTPQFTVSQYGGINVDSSGNVTQLRSPLEGSSTIWQGSSGAAMCNIEGNHVGVVKNIPPMEPFIFGIERNPPTIQSQISRHIDLIRANLETMFGVLSEAGE